MNCKTLLTLIPLTFALACKDGNDAATDSGVEGYARTDSGAATRVGGLTGTGRR